MTAAPEPDYAGSERLRDRGSFGLVSDALAQGARLAGAEARLMGTVLKSSGRNLVMAAVGGVIALLAAGAAMNFLGAAMFFGLVAAELEGWVAALIVAGIFIAVVVIAALWAMRAVRVAGEAPKESIRSIRQDVAAVMEAVNHAAR